MPEAFQSPSRNSISVRSSAPTCTGRASPWSAEANETSRATMPDGLARLARDRGELALGRAAMRPLSSGASRELLDGFERRPQLVHHARDQAAHRGQFFGAEELFLHRPLLQQPDRDARLVRQVLRQFLLVVREDPRRDRAGPIEHARRPRSAPTSAQTAAIWEHGRSPAARVKGLRSGSGIASGVWY